MQVEGSPFPPQSLALDWVAYGCHYNFPCSGSGIRSSKPLSAEWPKARYVGSHL